MSELPASADYRSIFLRDTPLLDTRAPVEFARGAFPGAENWPLMNDAERAAVGLCYRHQGQQAAIELGQQMVCGLIKEERVAAWAAFARHHPQGYLYCFRGGLRSRIVQQWLHEAGIDYPRITGGYKAMRRFLIDNLEALVGNSRWLVIGGRTGCGKTDLLHGVPASIDLERLANHRGSSFGRRAVPQPPQIGFENALSIALLRAHTDYPQLPLVVEDESHLIGRCRLPPSLHGVMQEAPLLLLEASLEERVERTYHAYILGQLSEWQGLLGAAAGFEQFAESLRQALFRIRNRLGGSRYNIAHSQIVSALVRHESGDSTGHRDWIRHLLVDYYDPIYAWQLAQKQSRIVVRGSADEVLDYVRTVAVDTADIGCRC